MTSITLTSTTVDDAVVMSIAQHCSKLETFKVPFQSEVTYHSLLALSVRSLPLKELSIPRIPNIPTADIARRCSHALSCIRHLDTYYLHHNGQDAPIFLPYMAGLTNVYLADHSIPFIPLLTQYCRKIQVIEVDTVRLPVLDIL